MTEYHTKLLAIFKNMNNVQSKMNAINSKNNLSENNLKEHNKLMNQYSNLTKKLKNLRY
jgi:hypothetical protein